MSAQPPARSPARILAPLALLACAIALLLVVGAALGGDDDTGSGGSGAQTSEQATTAETTATEAPARPRPRTYTVKAGDNLDLIAEKTGVPRETLEELNPEVDPFALDIGQQITLRE